MIKLVKVENMEHQCEDVRKKSDTFKWLQKRIRQKKSVAQEEGYVGLCVLISVSLS